MSTVLTKRCFQSIRSFRGDLAALTAPPFLLSGVSLTEHPAYWAERTDLLTAPVAEPDPTRRMLLMLRWYLCALKPQFTKRGRGRKPLNPFLGEIFLAKLQNEQGITRIVTEQVSHHPPVTAYHIWNEEYGIQVDGYHRQRAYFSGTVHLDRVGHILIHLDKYDEGYVIGSLPKLRLEGLIPPPPYPEMEGSVRIVSSTGYIAKIDYYGRGWFRGKRNSFIARMYHESTPDDILFTCEGQWLDGSFTIKDAKTQKTLETISTSGPLPLPPLVVAPIAEQDPLESRRAWNQVVQGIEKGDISIVAHEKSKLEEEQRAMRRKEKSEGREWQPRYFVTVQEWPALDRLLHKIGMSAEHEISKGIWKWAADKTRDERINDELRAGSKAMYNTAFT